MAPPKALRPKDSKDKKKNDVGGAALSSSTMFYTAGAVAVLAVCYFLLFSEQRVRVGVCGDGVCGYDEDENTCSRDCRGSCGDGFCSVKETCVGGGEKLRRRKECMEDCGQCTTINLPTCQAEAGMDAVHNSTMLWGTYRPHLFFGTRTRSTTPVYFGLMWHEPANPDKMRYDAGRSEGVTKYGWVEHDGKSFGHQVIDDTELGIQLNTTFVKYKHEEAKSKGGDWSLRVSGNKIKSGTSKGGEVTLVFHLSTHGKKGGMGLAEIGENTQLVATRTGSTAATGTFTTQIFALKGGIPDVHHFSMNADERYAAIADKVLRNVYAPSETKAREAGNQGPIKVSMPDIDQHGAGANIAFVQVTIPTPFEVEFVFLNHAAHGLGPDADKDAVMRASEPIRGASLTELIEERRASFSRRFDEMFGLKTKKCIPTSASPYKRGKQEERYPACTDESLLSEHAQTLGKTALSQLMGGMNYLHGNWFKSTPPFYNNSVEQPVAVSFSGSPCRNGFARGFLWDEGFHQLLVSRWEPVITRDVILHWFNLMQPEGWIPREHFIGEETRRHIEPRWWVQNPTHANPPTLLLALESLMDHGEASPGFLNCIKPRVLMWLNWFRRTQKADGLYSFKWSGRVQTDGIWHTLSSGLDDYPRSNQTSAAKDRHVDLMAWVATMLRVMDKIEVALGAITPTQYGKAYDELALHVDAVHWDKDGGQLGMYADRGVMAYPNGKVGEGFARHYGYVSIFPFLLRMVAPGNKTEAMMSVMLDRDHLRSKAGLRSLSKTAPGGGPDLVYGTQEDYWRGKVWICANYLALQALKLKYATGSEQGAKLYNGLRAAIVDNMVAQYGRKGFIFEQYDDKTGEGLKHKPFAGWSALVLLIMSEMY